MADVWVQTRPLTSSFPLMRVDNEVVDFGFQELWR